jgi:hypothetical protein
VVGGEVLQKLENRLQLIASNGNHHCHRKN